VHIVHSMQREQGKQPQRGITKGYAFPVFLVWPHVSQHGFLQLSLTWTRIDAPPARAGQVTVPIVASVDPAALREEILQRTPLIEHARMLERREDEQPKLARLKEALTQQGMFKDPQMKLLATRGL
jgi:hypothetical protein